MKRRRESGFALLLVFLMAGIIAIMLYRQLPRAAFESMRAKEEMLIERGSQYQRAIQLYVNKLKQYPQSMDDLEKSGGQRFLRRRYKDPFTGKDEWRLIHVNAAGQLTDSLVKKKESEKKENLNTFITENAGLGQTDPNLGGTGVNPALRRRASDGTPEGGQLPLASPDSVLGQSANPQAQTPQVPNPLVGSTGTQPGQPDPSQVANNPQFAQAGNQMPVQPGQPVPVQPGQPVSVQPGQPVPVQGQFPQNQFPQNQFPNQASPFPITPGMQPGQQPFPQQPGQQPPPFPQQQQPGQQPFIGGGMQAGQPQQPFRPEPPPSESMNPLPGEQRPQPTATYPTTPAVQPGRPGGGENPALQAIMKQLTTARSDIPMQVAPGLQLGGGIAGVATKHEGAAIKVYNEQQEYHKWEFLYDPKKDKRLLGALAGQMPMGNQQGQPGMPAGMGQPGMGQPGMGQPGMGGPGMGTPGAGTPGAGTPGAWRPGGPAGGFGASGPGGMYGPGNQQAPFPQQPGQFPQQPGQFPQQPGQFPQQPGQFPQQPGQFPQQPGQFPQPGQQLPPPQFPQPGQPGGFPPQPRR